MFKPLLKISRHTLILTINVVAVTVVLSAIGFGLFLWNLSRGPISLGWAKDYVEDALSNEEEQLSVKFDNMVFTWPELQGPFLLDLSNLKVSKGGTEADSLTIERASVGLSRGALFFGRIRPVSVIIKSPSLELVRTRDGQMNLFIKDKETQEAKPLPDVEQKPDPGQELGQIFKDMATHKRGSFISRLDKFIIKDASVAVRDYEYGLSWYLTDLDFGMAEHPDGVAASLDIDLPGGRDKEASIKMDMVYRKKTDDFRAAAHIQGFNPYFISRFMPVPDVLAGQDLFLTGDLEVAADTNLKPSYIGFKGAIPSGSVSIPEEYDAPITLKDIAVEAQYSAGKQMLEVSNLSGEIGGVQFKGEARGSFAEKSMGLPIELSFSNIVDIKQIPPLFPKSEHDGEAYAWIGRDIEGGKFSNVLLKMELSGEKTHNADLDREEWSFDVPQLKLTFDFEDASVRYSHTLMPVTEGKGRGLLDLGTEELKIYGDSAKVGDLVGSNIKVFVTDLMKAGAGYVAIDLNAKGPLGTALDYIADEPIGMDKEDIGIDAAKVKGNIDAHVHIALPTVKDVPKEDVHVDIEGVLSDLNIPEVVEGLTLSGGPLNLKTEEGGFRIEGDAALAGRPTKLKWHQFFESAGNPYSMQINASIGADQELRNHFGVNLDEYISGTVPVDVVYTSKGDNTQSVEVKGDLTPSRIYIKPFKFEKKAGEAGSIVAKGAMVDNVLKELSGVTLGSKDLSVNNATIKFAPMNGKSADLSSGTLPDAKIGKTQMAVTFDVDKNNVMKINAKGPVFDLGPFLDETESSDIGLKAQETAPKEKQQAMAITLTADTMLGENDQKVRSAKTYMEMDTDGDITRLDMDGGVGKTGSLFVRFKPEAGGKRTFRLETNDAGATLYTFGVYENIHGGNLLIYGEPKGGDLRGDLFGSMRMENFRVVKAPALASLLSLMSLSGVGDLLGNQGLVFSKLEADYEWRFRPSGNLLIIKDGKTSGSSIGLTFEGVVDRGKKTTDVSGTIIPMTEINSLIAKIPLLGNILGGETGLIAATYTMKGPSSKPSVMVNPLSVLAPGFLRNILFEGGFKSKIPDDPATAPKKAPEAKKNAPAKNTAKPAPNSTPKPTNTINKSKPAN